jgi:ATP-dependent helicase HrpB
MANFTRSGDITVMSRPRETLPVDEVLGDVVAAVRRGKNAVVVAPPGAGKTTRVPQALVDGGREGAVLVLEPRRLAARLAAKRIAFEREVKVGGEVGYQVRFDDRTSRETRIAFLTEGILTRRLQSDPTLDGVSVVILDEAHERSVHADLALAFLREIQDTVRPDLSIIAMSATIDAAPFASFLRAETIESRGRMYPVAVEMLEEPDDRWIPERTAAGVRRMLRGDGAGDILVFLPGGPEIRKCEELLQPLAGSSLEILPLYGELSVDAQDRAVEKGARRKIVLATNIAESSLTIPGVTAVVDCGYAKVLRHDPASGIDRLELARISKKSAAQRTGRAGRTAPGRALRLWTEKEDRLLADSDAPEIMRIDLAPVLLEILRWSSNDPRRFGWFERPPEVMITRALGLLELLGAIERGSYKLTPTGEKLADFPLHPRLARLLLAANERGVLAEGSLVAAILSERDFVRRSERLSGTSDVVHRVDLFRELEASRFHPGLADRMGVDAGTVRAVASVRDRLFDMGKRLLPKRTGVADEDSLLRAVLAAFPDRVGKRRGERVHVAGIGGAKMADESVVRDASLMVAVEVAGTAKGPLVRQASAVQRSWLDEDTRGVRKEKTVRFNAERSVVECVEETIYVDFVLESKNVPCDDELEVARVLAEAARADLERALPVDEDAAKLLARLDFMRRTGADMAGIEGDPRLSLLEELCYGARSFSELRARNLASAIRNALPKEVARALDVWAPERIEIPSGRNSELRYDPDAPPAISVRLQEVFGMMKTPRVAGGRVAVKMELLAPNMRPVQVTQDLESFWANMYAEVRGELRRRYPKHQWPEDPRDGDPRKKPGRRR